MSNNSSYVYQVHTWPDAWNFDKSQLLGIYSTAEKALTRIEQGFKNSARIARPGLYYGWAEPAWKWYRGGLLWDFAATRKAKWGPQRVNYRIERITLDF